jgi:hypothetical protein
LDCFQPTRIRLVTLGGVTCDEYLAALVESQVDSEATSTYRLKCFSCLSCHSAVAEAIRQTEATLSNTVPIVRITTMNKPIDSSIVPKRLIAMLSAGFGALGATEN